ncbi:Leu/Phe/Val dehydrogenase [Ferruginivarius sediminum]|uniref:Glu/Leu/Phe/Val dehydrogenase n=1 Tax=Ferruginivarius sediminum TaxID=2661937 RepID=A0A369TDB6_9PROT|nr:Glu/Leu/Phe/Val dehydrogenase [Ferruginivarius sediminum]RDD62822.1 Glu/Leu/Phe/Val dehydrogenase [Ferruginivarius sediminum]
MSVFDNPAFDAHEEVVFSCDADSGLKAIIAIHNTSRGPALGGCRMWNYADESAALADVLRLSRGMTYKSALAGLPYGGGKSVIIGDPARDKSPALFRAMGRAVQVLGGSYTVAEDVGISVEDVEEMGRETRHVAGVSSGGAGDPSPATAYGVYMGIRAAVAHKLGRDDLRGVTVAVQGAGHVGAHLCRYLAHDGADVLIADIDNDRAKRVAHDVDARLVDVDDIVAAQADVFAPCALGGIIDDRNLARLRAGIVAGSANNQLAEPRHGQALKDRGILYAPDYVINAGGIINISHEGPDYDKSKAFGHVGRIHDTLLEIFRRADRAGVSTAEAADRLAEERFTHPRPAAAAAA